LPSKETQQEKETNRAAIDDTIRNSTRIILSSQWRRQLLLHGGSILLEVVDEAGGALLDLKGARWPFSTIDGANRSVGRRLFTWSLHFCQSFALLRHCSALRYSCLHPPVSQSFLNSRLATSYPSLLGDFFHGHILS
jgi:hypothetical protein